MKLPVLARSWAFMRPYRRLILLASLGIVGSTLITVAGPALLKYAIDEGIQGGDEGAIRRAALAYLALVLVRPLLERLVVVCSARAGERFLGRLRVAAYEHLQRLSMPFFESERAGVLVARLTSDVQTLTTFTRHVLIEVVGSILLLVLTGIAIVLLSPVLAAVVLVSFPLIVVSALSYQRRSHPSYLFRRRLALLARRHDDRDGRRGLALSLLALRPDRPPWRLVVAVPVRTRRADEARRAARDARDGARRPPGTAGGRRLAS